MKNLFSARLDIWYNWYLLQQEAVHYAIHSILCINTLKEKYIKLSEQVMHIL